MCAGPHASRVPGLKLGRAGPVAMRAGLVCHTFENIHSKFMLHLLLQM